MTARYNGYYWSSEAIKEGVFKIEGNNKDNYDKLLPVYVIPGNEAAKTTFPEFDKAIKKSSLVIQRHTIKDKKDNEIPAAGKWIDNNWINIGISRFYKREFFSGIEAFDYVVRTYKTKDKYKALLWQAKALNEVGAVSQSEPIIALLNNDKKITKRIKSQLGALKGDYFIKRGLYKEAIGSLTEAANQKGILRKGLRKKERARYAFIAGQLYEEEKNPKKAREFYEKALSLKPSYDMVFYANIKLARLTDTKRGGAEKTKAKLLRMTKDTKNAEYLDVIYFTLGEIEEKERHTDKAIEYYTKSAQTSVSNLNQKALSYLKLGDIYFENSNYYLSEGYYDSTIVVLPKDHPNYNNIVNRKNTLSTLVGYIRVIQREDSLQKIARLSESDRNKAIDKIIAKIEDDEQRRIDELDAIKSQNLNPLTNNTATNPGDNIFGGSGGWYFYNQTTISFGIADFAKRWGNRKLEDNWRRSQKGLTIDNSNTDNEVVTTKTTTTGNGKNSPKANQDPRKTREYYLRKLPLTDTLMKISHDKIIEADYLLGSTYKEELNNNKRSIAAFEDLNKRYAEHKYRLQTYYQLYRGYLAEKNQEQSDYYKNKLLTDYPNSEYSKLIKNPKYAEERNAQRGEVEKFYESTFDLYSAGNYEQALAQCNEAFTKYGKTDFSAKFELVRAMCIGHLKGTDSLTWAINEFLILYPNSEVTPRANEILMAIKRQRNPAVFENTEKPKASTDTFNLKLDAEHFVLIISPDDPKIVNPLKTAIDVFGREYYSNKSFSISSNLFAGTQQMILVKSFPDAKEAYTYIENLKNDAKIYKGNLKKELFTFLIISSENLPHFYKKANVSSYQAFYNEAYKTVIQQPK